MKFGSVAFFKRLIVIAVVVLIVVPVALSVTFGVLYGRQLQRADWLERLNWALLNSTDLPEDLKTPENITQYLQNPPPDATLGPSFEYQKAYPALYVTRPETEPTEGKVCYLTFDDGPSPVTLQILKILGDYDIKATFFVTGGNTEKNADVLRAAADAGHTIGVHTYSHKYDEIYASPDAFLQDFARMNDLIVEATGTAPSIFRFPGGSINAYSAGNYQQIIAEMTRRGFVYFDWNAAGEDAVAGGIAKADIVANVLNSVGDAERAVVLLHDRQDCATTAAALPAIIEALQEEGYRFAPLTPQVQPVTFFYQD